MLLRYLTKKQKKNQTIREEAASMKLASKCKLLSMVPPDIIGKLKTSDEFKAYMIQIVKSSKYTSVKSACKSIGFSTNTYYKNKDKELGDCRTKFPLLIVLDYLLDNRHIDRDSLALKMISAGIPITTKETGNLRRQALSYIKHHKLRKNPSVYQFLNLDDAWAMDFMYFYNKEGKVKYHLKIIDDRSRLDVGNAILDRATTDAAFEVLEQSIKRTGRKPSAVKTDRGTQFKVRFSNFLKEKGISHLKSYPNMPQFNAKIERRFKDVRLFNLVNPQMDLETLVITESNIHNFVRPHESLSGLTPSDVYWKRKGPPFEKPDSKIESITKWHPSANVDLEVAIST